MKKTSIPFTVKKIMQKIRRNEILFSHCVQREENQWSTAKKSLFLHSILGDLPIPPIYTYLDDDGSYQVLDGKQRLTIIQSYINNEFSLIDVPEVEVEGTEYEINGLKFEELPKDLQSEIEGFSFVTYILTDCSEEMIYDIFFRLNNGESLTPMQQTRAKLGNELMLFIDDTLKLPFFTEKASFTPQQLKKSENQSCILQTMMLLKDYKYKKFGAEGIRAFVESFKDNLNQKELEEYKNLFIKLNEAFTEKHKMIKKIHIPMFVMALKTSEDIGIEFTKFTEWINDFIKKYDNESEYCKLCSGNTTNREKVTKRLDLINNSLIDYAIGGAE